MNIQDKVRTVQKELVRQGIDGWLLYDYRRNNELCCHFLEIPEDLHLTRRFFYLIPAKGEPVRLVHSVEPEVLHHLPGSSRIYLRWQELEEILRELLKGMKRVAMEYSPFNRLPAVSRVDGGTIELISSMGVHVVSSAPLLQYFTAIWDETKFQDHLDAANFLDQLVTRVWDWIRQSLEKEHPVSEWDISQWLFHEFEKNGFCSDSPPICAANAHSADPHYLPVKDTAARIRKGDFILLDLWCRKKKKGATYADISRVGVIAGMPTKRQEAVFKLVRQAQRAATEFIQRRFDAKQEVKGFEADEVCRNVIKEGGFADFFTHRTGHNIDQEGHGPGTHLDSLETFDDRPLLPRTCFSIEPGIYLPGEFGVRLEYDVYIHPDGRLQITGGIQEKIHCLF